MLEGPIIPKSMKGAREPGSFIVPLPLCVGVARPAGTAVSRRCRAGHHRAGPGRPPAHLAGSVARKQLQRLYNPLVQSLADAAWLNAHCKSLADARFAEERKRLARPQRRGAEAGEGMHEGAISTGEAARDEHLRRINEDLRPADGRGPDQAGQRDERGRPRPRAADGRDSGRIGAKPRQAR